MKFRREKQTVRQLVDAWEAGSLTRNPEYQRGAAWSVSQKQALVDSVFRSYPIPPIFLERRSSAGLFGTAAEQFEIIDGQQRILALSGYCADEFPLLKPSDEKLKLPHSLRAKDTPWSDRTRTQLPPELRRFLDEAEIEVFLVESVENPDEIRDLFIRLQSGTALTRQQIRDAWPGGVAPLIETFAGKLQKHPKYLLFQAVDARGLRDEESDPKDRYVKHRQTCAQLMRILVARASDPRSFPSVRADDVDSFYHEHTDYTALSPMVQEIERVFYQVERVTKLIRSRWSGKKKISKLSLFALAFFFQDMQKNQYWKLDDSSAERLADYSANVEMPGKARTTDGPQIREFYDAWILSLPTTLGIRVDARRTFDDKDKGIILARDDGKCQICRQVVVEGEAEYDHFPIAWTLGGETTPENGRLVHARCHPRGKAGLHLRASEIDSNRSETMADELMRDFGL